MESYFAISRPEGVSTPLERPPYHDRWYPDRLTGRLTFHLTTLPGSFVSSSTGHLVLGELDSRQVVALEAIRSRGCPVLPGTGIKGAVRTLYELLSSSCDPFQSSACTVPKDKTRMRLCPACSLFGRLDWQGRVTFSDAEPVGPVEAFIAKVPTPFEPHEDQTKGDQRHYNLGPAKKKNKDTSEWEERPEDFPREVYRGTFQTTLSFWNTSQDEMGRLLLCMGLQPDGSPRFHLRLGGATYHGKGGVAVEPRELMLLHRSGASGLGSLEKEDSPTPSLASWMRGLCASESFQPYLSTWNELAAKLEATS